MENVFFGENGLTSTSANFIANQAKEYVESLKEYLDTTSFMDSSIELIGSNNETLSHKGFSDKEVKNISETLDAIVKAYSLIAWLREALKAKSKLEIECTKYTMEKWAADNGIELPKSVNPVYELTEEDVISQWSVKDRNKYLTAQTFCSVYGKYIHPDGAYSKARKEFFKKRFDSIEYTECGSNTIIHRYLPSATQQVVDDTFKTLQRKWRDNQAIVNSYKHKIELAIQEDYLAKNDEYRAKCEEYKNKYNTLNAEYNAYMTKLRAKNAALKIIIPNDLKEIYDIIKNK